MAALSILLSFVPLVLMILAAWGVVRILKRPLNHQRTDPAVAIRRFFLYGLAYVALVVAGQGIVELFWELLEPADERSNAAIARSLSFAIVGIPAAAGLLVHLDRRLGSDADERQSLAWMIYLNLALLTTAAAAMIETHTWVRTLLGAGDDPGFELATFAAATIWGALWAGHWFFLRRRHGVPGDLDQAVGTLLGLVPLAIGLGGLLYVAADEIYNALADRVDINRGPPSAAAFAATVIVGGVVWVFYWLGHYARARRTTLWYVTVVPIGALTGFVTAVAMAATTLYLTATWFFGEPTAREAVNHFDFVTITVPVLIVAVVGWRYHHWLLGPEPDRNDAVRSYDYLIAAAALVTGVIGVVLIFTALFARPGDDVANTAIAGITLAAVGGPLWFWFWRRIQQQVGLDRPAELQSPLRRVYVFSLFGAAALSGLFALLAVLTTTIEAALDGTLGRETLHDDRVGLGVLLAVSGVAWYHFTIFRSERASYVVPPPPPPPPPSATDRVRHVIVVAPPTAQLLADGTEFPGLSFIHWSRSDDATCFVPDTSQLADAVRTAALDHDLLVIVEEDGASIVGLDEPDAPLPGFRGG